MPSPSSSTCSPPQVPDDAVYTANYCEENVYLLAKHFLQLQNADSLRNKWDIHVVFISNSTKSVALWGQKLNVSESAVVWDYHVILVLRAKPRAPNAARSDVHTIGDPAAEGVLEMKIGECEDDESNVPTCASWVYDFDSRAGMPCSMQEYISQTFPQHAAIPAPYRSTFRVVPAEEYVETFASDRSHMLIDKGGTQYLSPPPSYPPLCGAVAKAKGVTNNLMESFVNMQMEAGEERIGQVKDMDDFVSWGLWG